MKQRTKIGGGKEDREGGKDRKGGRVNWEGKENKKEREREDEWPLWKHRVSCPEPLNSYCCRLGLSVVHGLNLDDKT